MKKILKSLLLFATGYLLLATFVSAQSKEITFPLPQLNYCRDAHECFSYCEIPQNKPLCQQFLQQHSSVLGVADTQFGITYPIAELGNCSDRDTCRTYCQDDANKNSCQVFASKQQIKIRRSIHSLVNQAQDRLGCSSLADCRALCQNPDNADSCRSFGQTLKQLNQTREATSPALMRPNIKTRLENQLRNDQ